MPRTRQVLKDILGVGSLVLLVLGIFGGVYFGMRPSGTSFPAWLTLGGSVLVAAAGVAAFAWTHRTDGFDNPMFSTNAPSMPALKDEMALNVDGVLTVDPPLGLREQAQRSVASRQWSTASVYCGDQAEPEFCYDKPSWSLCFCLGLDHVSNTRAEWFADVAAIAEFVRTIAVEAGCEFTVEFRLRSRPWYSETLAHIDDDPNREVDLAGLRAMLEHFTRQRRSWWRKLTRP